jgi:hypothetical protein
MTFTIEPMITIGSPSANLWDDGWTAATKDLGRTAQFEHTILVEDHGVEILTVEENESQPFIEGANSSEWPQTLLVGPASTNG